PPPTTGPPAACTARYRVTGQWSGGFQGEVEVVAGSTAVNGWTVNWAFPNGQQISSSWSATVTASGSSVTARNVGYNGNLAAGTSTTFGFLASWNGTNAAPATLTCTAGA
ncbi:cellulose binding domain-containing protein, partial [Micromonospora echinofusca]